jgi:hypothetical protein
MPWSKVGRVETGRFSSRHYSSSLGATGNKRKHNQPKLMSITLGPSARDCPLSPNRGSKGGWLRKSSAFTLSKLVSFTKDRLGDRERMYFDVLGEIDVYGENVRSEFHEVMKWKRQHQIRSAVANHFHPIAFWRLARPGGPYESGLAPKAYFSRADMDCDTYAIPIQIIPYGAPSRGRLLDDRTPGALIESTMPQALCCTTKSLSLVTAEFNPTAWHAGLDGGDANPKQSQISLRCHC